MEPENVNQEAVQAKQVNRLHQVTPLSKYLALALFIALPFLGGWIGYTYAPEKIVEVERVVMQKIEVEKELNNDCSEGFEATCSLNPEYYSSLDIFLNVQEMLDTTSVEWVRSDAYREYDLLAYLPNLTEVIKSDNDLYSTGCYGYKCQSVTLIGDRYSYRQMNNANEPEKYDISSLRDYLEQQGFIFLYEVAKGWQFSEVFQKTVDETSQVVRISSKPINLVLPEDGGYPSSDGSESRIFVSSPFSVK